MSSIICINVISIILAIIGILLIMSYSYKNNNNKSTFYGGPNGMHRALTESELGPDRGWATFGFHGQNYFSDENYDKICDPITKKCETLYGNSMTSASPKYIEFAPGD